MYPDSFITYGEYRTENQSRGFWSTRRRVIAVLPHWTVIGAGHGSRLNREFAATTREIPAIAVLPFLNLSSEPENEYFSDGLADQLTDALAQVDGLRVRFPNVRIFFRGKPLDASEIGAKLR